MVISAVSSEVRVVNSTDVFIIGGGPAGLAAAIAARQRGFRVMVADGAAPPIDKACGEGFLPDGLAALERLGIQIPCAESWAFHGIRFLSGYLSADAPFRERTFGLAVRRTVLHRALIERAEQVGAKLLWGTPVMGVSREGVRVRAGLVRARWIIGADGANSGMRRWAALEAPWRPRLRFAFRRHYRVAPWTDYMEVYWGERCQGYATAVDGQHVCIALASHDPSVRVEDGLRELPELNSRLRGADAVTTERGALTGNRWFRKIWRGNVALIGDASGTVDAITGEGIGLAFSQALALAESLESGNLARYQDEHRRLMLRPRLMARLMLSLDGRPWLQRRTLRAFNKRPRTFQRLVELHVGALSPVHVAFDGLSLGWGLLTA
jgi:menaquinone-9 beta-reductase